MHITIPVSLDIETLSILELKMVSMKTNNRSLAMRSLIREAVRFKKVAILMQGQELTEDLLSYIDQGIISI